MFLARLLGGDTWPQDNLPHDKVSWDAAGRPWEHHIVCAVRGGGGGAVVPDGRTADISSEAWEEVVPLADPLLSRCLDAVGTQLAAAAAAPHGLAGWLQRWMPAGDGGLLTTAYVPTGALQLLEAAARIGPPGATEVVLADFDALPHPLPGRLGPTVQRRWHGRTVTYDTLLVPPGTCDIMFPTDGAVLAALHAFAFPAMGLHAWKQADFLRAYAPDFKRAQLQDGFNPLLDDYLNVSVWASTPTAPVQSVPPRQTLYNSDAAVTRGAARL